MAGLSQALREHQLVGLDTMTFIYHFEATTPAARAAGVVLEELAQGSFGGVTSVLTLMEVAVKPFRLGKPDVVEEYEVLLLNYPNLRFVDVSLGIARQAARLRAERNLRSADALQVATCLLEGATAFVTNDYGLRNLDGISVLILEDFGH